MTKKELRKIFREKRNALTPAEKSKLDDLLLIQFQGADLPFIGTVLSYWPIGANNEPATHLFTRYLECCNPGIQIAYPKADFGKNELHAIATTGETSFVMTVHQIYEPGSNDVIAARGLDMILVPLLAFDKEGYRVGYGKGFYDKFLAGCRKDCIKAGFSYFPPVDNIPEKGEFDVPLDLCITPQTVYVF